MKLGKSREPGAVASSQITERIEVFARELCEEMGEVDESMGVCWLDAIENQAIAISDALHTELVKKKSTDQQFSVRRELLRCYQTAS